MQNRIALILLALMTCPHPFAQARMEQTSTYVPVTQFDAKRDASADISAAIAEAQRTQKRIILYVGGPWCPYCDQLEGLFLKNPDLRNLRDAHFITVHIYIGPENQNASALAPYTQVLGVPHFFVLRSNGTLLHSQHVLELRSGGEYSPSKMKDFLNRWSSPDDIATNK